MPKPLMIFIATVLIAGGFFMTQTLQLPGSDEVSTFIGPRLWPLMVLAILLIMTLLLFIRTLLTTRRGAMPEDHASSDIQAPIEETLDQENTGDSKENAMSQASAWRHWLLLGLIIAWTVAMAYIGFLAATAIFTAAAAWLLGNRRPLPLALTTLAGVFMVSIVFDYLLNIPLP